MQAIRYLAYAFMLALFLLLLACTLANVQTREDFFEVGDAARVEADVDVSRLTVRSGSAGQVRVQATLRYMRQTDYQVTQAGDTVHIYAHVRPGLASRLAQPKVEIIVTVPRNTDLELRSSTGYLYVDEVSGHIVLTTSSGGIQLSDSEGRIELQTQTGSIACRRVRGAWDIRSGTGSVDLVAVSGVFDVETGTGAISFEGELDPVELHRFVSEAGAIDLHILGSPDLRIDAVSRSGLVRCGLKMAEQVSTKRECKGVLGAGTAQLRVCTSTGSINIR